MTRRDLLQSAGLALFQLDSVRAASADRLPGTEPLTWEGDHSARMMDGAHQYVDRKIVESIGTRQRFWKRDLSSRAAYERSVEGNRTRLRSIAGVVDARERTVLERFGGEDD